MPEPVATDSPTKRTATAAGHTVPHRSVKRRAAKACQCCRSRKVRCNVVENGTPCTNCRLDEVECIVSASKRKRRSKNDEENTGPSPTSSPGSEDSKIAFHDDSPTLHDNSVSTLSSLTWQSLESSSDHHVPHMIYQAQAQRPRPRPKSFSIPAQQPLESKRRFNSQMPPPSVLYSPPTHSPSQALPTYFRPVPNRWMAEDSEYLHKKGALRIPSTELRDALLRSYSLYIHPYMPLLNLGDLVGPVCSKDGNKGTISLLLFQAAMFAATAFVDIEYLQRSGFESRRLARRAFFQKARLLYDFDYESDRLTLVQALLLMTYWYETPDDQKDTWHWMGVSLSLAQTIGLHRDPSRSKMDKRRQGLWKRVWWSCYMRDRLIALGMRRPLRIKNEDCDVPMLSLEDFDLGPLSPDALQILGERSPLNHPEYVRQLAVMCIEKAKLSICTSHVLTSQYSVFSDKLGGSTETTMMLVPRRLASDASEVMACDEELEGWFRNLPHEAYSEPLSISLSPADDILFLHRALLKMVYLATSSALHRPQVLRSSPLPALPIELEELSRKRVRDAARDITETAQRLHQMNLTRYLPTTAVTVLLPAIIIHLLDIKSVDPTIRAMSLQRFSSCMKILHQLRDIYASADFATSFLDAAIRKANIPCGPASLDKRIVGSVPNQPTWGSVGRTNMSLTPPPDPAPSYPLAMTTATEYEPVSLDMAETPPKSDGQGSAHSPNIEMEGSSATLADLMNIADEAESIKNDFEELINFEALSDIDFSVTDESREFDMNAQGESGGMSLDMKWMNEAGALDRSNMVTGDIEQDLLISDAL